VEVAPQECRDALTTGKITVEGQSVDFQVGASKFHRYYTKGGRSIDGVCTIMTLRGRM
jgi:CelD/BcsL family acetyltransferase involved in cellulose biosynthesis